MKLENRTPSIHIIIDEPRLTVYLPVRTWWLVDVYGQEGVFQEFSNLARVGLVIRTSRTQRGNGMGVIWP